MGSRTEYRHSEKLPLKKDTAGYILSVKWILYIIVDSKPAENLIWDVLLFLIAQHWEIFQALSKLYE